MNSKDDLINLVEMMTSERSADFSRLAEMRGIRAEDLPAYFKRAQQMSEMLLQVSNTYAKQAGLDRMLFCAVAAGMASDSAVRGMVSDEQDDAMTARSLAAISSRTDTVQ